MTTRSESQARLVRGTWGLAVACCLLAAVPHAANAALPDGRAFEKISPADKNGGPIVALLPVLGGDELIYAQTSAGDDSVGGQAPVLRVGRRSPTGWSSTDLTYATSSASQLLFPSGTSTSLETVFGFSNGALDPARPGVTGPFALDVATRKVTALPGTPVAATNSDGVLVYSNAQGIYRQAPGGTPERVSVLPNGSPAIPGRDAFENLEAPYLDPVASNARGIDEASGLDGTTGSSTAVGAGWTHPASTDGERVFFYFGDNQRNPAQDPTRTNPLYVRDGNARTVAVSASQRTGQVGDPQPARFIGASPDGRTVFFASDAALTNATDGGGVYRFDLDSDTLTRLTGDPGADGLRITSGWASEDASTVYFVASSALTPGATDGAANIYVWRDGTLRLVASSPSGGVVERVSRNGDFALVSSTASLAGSDTGGTTQLFRYRADDQQLTCVSCRADGSANEQSASLTLAPPFAFGQPLSSPRGLADDGRVFFTSTDRLVAGDPSDAPDVYEFSDAGVRLLSTGVGESYYADNTNDGTSVYIISTDRLTSADVDGGEYDLYDARIGGGFPETPRPPQCASEACRPGTSPGAPGPVVGSSQPGTGNIVLPKAEASSEARPVVEGRPRISADQRSALAKHGRARVKVRVSGSGKVMLRATMRVRGRTVVIARGSRTLGKAGARDVTVILKVSAQGGRELRRSGRTKLRLTVTMAGARGAKGTTVVVPGSTR